MATRDELVRLTNELVKRADHKAVEENASDARRVYGSYGDLRALIDRIRPVVDQFLHFPEDSAFSYRLTDLSYVLARLSPGDMPADLVSGGKSFLQQNTELIGLVKTLSQNLTMWTGDAAREFKESFANKLEGRLKNQFLATQVLHAMLAAEQGLWQRTTDDLAQVLKDAKIAIDRLDDCDSSPAESFLLTLIGASIATVSAPLGGLAIIVWTGVSSVPTASAKL